MKQSVGDQVGLASKQEEPLDAAGDAGGPRQGIKLDESPQEVQDQQGNVGEGSFQAASGVALQSTEALGSCKTFQEVERGTVQVDRGFAVQPTQAALPSASNTFSYEEYKEYINVLLSFKDEEENFLSPMCQAYIADNFQEQTADNFQEQPDVKEIGGFAFQPTQFALPDAASTALLTVTNEEEETFAASCFQGLPNDSGDEESVHQEEEFAGVHDQIVQQSPTAGTIDLRNGQGETLRQEEDTLRNDGWMELIDLNEPIDVGEDIGIQMQESPPKQGSAGRRMRLQVSSLYSATDCKGNILGLQHCDACNRSHVGRCATCLEVEKASLSDFSVCACALLQQTMMRSSFVREVDINKLQLLHDLAHAVASEDSEKLQRLHDLAHAVASEDSQKPFVGRRGSSLAICCLFSIATMLALIFLCLLRGFCRLRRTAITSM